MAQSVRLLAVWDVVMQAGTQARNPKPRELERGKVSGAHCPGSLD